MLKLGAFFKLKSTYEILCFALKVLPFIKYKENLECSFYSDFF